MMNAVSEETGRTDEYKIVPSDNSIKKELGIPLYSVACYPCKTLLTVLKIQK